MIEELFEEVRKELKEAKIPISDHLAPVKVNSRTRTTLGRCTKKRKPIGKTEYTIEISKFVLDMERSRIKDIIAHELLHTCHGCFDHGYKWKEYGKVLKDKYGYNISTRAKFTEEEERTLNRRKEEYKYILRCSNCGQLFKRKRASQMTKHPERFRCGKCGGSIKKMK